MSWPHHLQYTTIVYYLVARWLTFHQPYNVGDRFVYALLTIMVQSKLESNSWSSFFHILRLSAVRGRIRRRETRVQVSKSPPLTSLDWGAFLWQSSTSIHIRQWMHNMQVC